MEAEAFYISHFSILQMAISTAPALCLKAKPACRAYQMAALMSE
jgi:uncharacterized membrane protein YwaF